MAFYFLVSKALKNQHSYLAKIKAQSLQAIELTNNSTQFFEKSKINLLFLKNNNRGYRLAVLMGADHKI
ncbi:hypothetical protein E5D91_00855 [Helicobacter pylori]|nr:hypothetical protein E5D91_00855 [Helicobacter pylori]